MIPSNITESSPLVSVLMPCYNAAAFLSDALDSIISQSYRNLEIVLIDDGSNDQSRSIIKSYELKDSRIRAFYNDSNIGLIKTLNKGLSLCTGRYIARMDADDISMPNRIQVLVDILEQDLTLDLVSGGCYSLNEEGQIITRVYPKACTPLAIKFVCFFITPVLHPCVVFRKSLMSFEKYDEDYLHSEDYEVFSRLLLKGSRFINFDQPLYMLRLNSQSVSRKYETIQISTHNRISFRNINEYFSIQYDYFVQRVMTNRINFSVPPALLRKSINNLFVLRRKFIELELPSPDEIVEIDGFLTEQIIDIHFQSIKNSRGILKIYHILSIINIAHYFFSKRGARYLKSKSFIKKR